MLVHDQQKRVFFLVTYSKLELSTIYLFKPFNFKWFKRLKTYSAIVQTKRLNHFCVMEKTTTQRDIQVSPELKGAKAKLKNIYVPSRSYGEIKVS